MKKIYITPKIKTVELTLGSSCLTSMSPSGEKLDDNTSGWGDEFWG